MTRDISALKRFKVTTKISFVVRAFDEDDASRKAESLLNYAELDLDGNYDVEELEEVID